MCTYLHTVAATHHTLGGCSGLTALLSRRMFNDRAHEFQLQNSQGQAVHLAPQDREALVLALALHEKGKVHLQQVRAEWHAADHLQGGWLRQHPAEQRDVSYAPWHRFSTCRRRTMLGRWMCCA